MCTAEKINLYTNINHCLTVQTEGSNLCGYIMVDEWYVKLAIHWFKLAYP